MKGLHCMSKQPRKSSRAQRHTQIEYISIFGATGYMAPLGLQFYADAFLVAAKDARAGTGFAPARPYLVCHALELALKAFLSLKGRRMTELAGGEFGHDLPNLLDEAQKQKLADLVSLNESQLFQINRASVYYVEKVFEYPANDEALKAYPQMPDIELLIGAAEALVTALREPCLNA
jgi:hypothetical protein